MTAVIDRLTADHYREVADFQRDQVERVADALQEVIDVVGFQPGPPYDYPLFKSIYSIPRLVEHVRAMTDPKEPEPREVDDAPDDDQPEPLNDTPEEPTEDDPSQPQEDPNA